LFLAGFIALAMYRIEKEVRYITIPNPQFPPENSYKIE